MAQPEHIHAYAVVTPSGRPLCECGFELEPPPDELDENPDLALFEDAPDEDDSESCNDCDGHVWRYTGTSYGGDDESYMGEGRCYCEKCGADGDA